MIDNLAKLGALSRQALKLESIGPVTSVEDQTKTASETAKALLAEQDRAAAKSITEHYTPKKTYSGYEWIDSRGGALPASKTEVLLYEILQELRREKTHPAAFGAP